MTHDEIRVVKYGIGTNLNAKWASPMDSPYEWGDGYTPLKVLKDYGEWLYCEVLPHYHLPDNFAMSKPYCVTVDKFDILSGRLLIKEQGAWWE